MLLNEIGTLMKLNIDHNKTLTFTGTSITPQSTTITLNQNKYIESLKSDTTTAYNSPLPHRINDKLDNTKKLTE